MHVSALSDIPDLLSYRATSFLYVSMYVCIYAHMHVSALSDIPDLLSYRATSFLKK